MNVLTLLVLAASLFVQDGPQDTDRARQGTYAITNARIETVSDGVLEQGTILIEGDRIVAIGKDVSIPPGAEVIDAAGQHVYPGMIDSGTQLGLVEIDSVLRFDAVQGGRAA